MIIKRKIFFLIIIALFILNFFGSITCQAFGVSPSLLSFKDIYYNDPVTQMIKINVNDVLIGSRISITAEGSGLEYIDLKSNEVLVTEEDKDRGYVEYPVTVDFHGDRNIVDQYKVKLTFIVHSSGGGTIIAGNAVTVGLQSIVDFNATTTYISDLVLSNWRIFEEENGERHIEFIINNKGNKVEKVGSFLFSGGFLSGGMLFLDKPVVLDEVIGPKSISTFKRAINWADSLPRDKIFEAEIIIPESQSDLKIMNKAKRFSFFDRKDKKTDTVNKSIEKKEESDKDSQEEGVIAKVLKSVSSINLTALLGNWVFWVTMGVIFIIIIVLFLIFI